MTTILHLSLALRLAVLFPSIVDPLAHVRAACTAASAHGVPCEPVLAIAWWESGCTVPLRTEPWHCGPMQVGPQWVKPTCTAMRQLPVGYDAGAEVLARWVGLSGGRWREAIRGYRCGWEGLRGECPQEPWYDDKVMATAARIGWAP